MKESAKTIFSLYFYKLTLKKENQYLIISYYFCKNKDVSIKFYLNKNGILKIFLMRAYLTESFIFTFI